MSSNIGFLFFLVFTAAFVAFLIYVRRKGQAVLKANREYWTRLGVVPRRHSPVSNPFPIESIRSFACFDLVLRPGMPVVLITAYYVSGSGKNTVFHHLLGMYFPPGERLTESWLSSWKRHIARRNDVWAQRSGVPLVERRWGLSGPPDYLPIRADRLPDGGVILVWDTLESLVKRQWGPRLDAVLQSFDADGGQVRTALPWSPTETTPATASRCPACGAALNENVEAESETVCSYCRKSFDVIVPHAPNAPLVLREIKTNGPVMIAATVGWALALTPLLLTFPERDFFVLFGQGNCLATVFGTAAASVVAGVWARTPRYALAMRGATGLVFILKPLIVPMRYYSESRGETVTFSLDSETHYWFLVPGGMLLLWAGISAIRLLLKK